MRFPVIPFFFPFSCFKDLYGLTESTAESFQNLMCFFMVYINDMKVLKAPRIKCGLKLRQEHKDTNERKCFDRWESWGDFLLLVEEMDCVWRPVLGVF